MTHVDTLDVARTAPLPGGRSVHLGHLATHTGPASATDFAVNGVPCETTPPSEIRC